MLLSTLTEALEHAFGFHEAVRIIKEVGFDAYDATLSEIPSEKFIFGGADYLERAKEARAYADSLGIVCNQSHAPFPSYRFGNHHWNSHIIEWCTRSIEVTSILGGKICIVHPYNNWTPQENAEITKAVLTGEKGPRRNAVALNAGAGLYVAGKAASLEEGVRRAEELIDSGAAMERLEAFIRLSNEA